MVADTNCHITDITWSDFNTWQREQSCCTVYLYYFLDMNNNQNATILSIVGSLLILFLIFQSNLIIYSALSIVLISYISPELTKYICKIFIILLSLAGKINLYVFTSLAFYLFICPIGILLKITSKKIPMEKNHGLSFESYFNERKKTFESIDFENPW